LDEDETLQKESGGGFIKKLVGPIGLAIQGMIGSCCCISIIVLLVAGLIISVSIISSGGNSGIASNIDTSVVGEKLSDEEIALLKQNCSLYIETAEKVDVPWEMIAAIHYREAGFGNASMGNG
jgi:hypothetical protein